MRRLIPLIVCASLVTCGDDPTSVDAPDPVLAGDRGLTVTIADPPAEMDEGSSAQLTATVTNPAGRAVDRPVSWSSSDTDVATVSEDGLLEALAGGTAEIGASFGASGDAFTLTVRENLPPVAGMDDPETPEDTPVVFELQGTDPDDPPETLRAYVEAVPGVGHLYQVGDDGTIDQEREIVVEAGSPAEVTNPGRLVGWVPPPDVFGPGASIGSGFTYHVRDPQNLASPPHEGVIDVTPVADAPVADDDAYSTDEDTPLEVQAPGVLDGDTDADGDALTAAVVSGPSHGSLSLAADGSFSYLPAPDFNGTDAFTYEAVDGTGRSGTATVTITVGAVNDVAVSDDDAYETDEDTPLEVAAPGVLGNDTDPDGDALTAAVVTGPSGGSLTLNADGSFTYTPAPDFDGTETFTYVANDGTLDGNTATVTIIVHPVNDVPVAADDGYSVDEDRVLEVTAPGVLENDTDADGDPLTATLVSGPANGTLTLNADGSFTYTPEADFDETDGFTYVARDGTGEENAATVTIAVEARNDAPVAAMDRPVGIEDTPLIFELEGTDVDDPDESLRAAVLQSPLFGHMYQVHEDGTIDYDNEIVTGGDEIIWVTHPGRLVAYIPNPNVFGDGDDPNVNINFSYLVEDPHGARSPFPFPFVFIDITPVNDAPVASSTVHELASHLPPYLQAPNYGIELDYSDVDIGDGLTAVVTRFPENGRIYRRWTLDEQDEITPEDPTFTTFVPVYEFELGSTGEPFDSFEYYVTDGELSTDVVEVVINVVDVNDPPNPVCPDGTEYDETGHPLTFAAGDDRIYPCSPTAVVMTEPEQQGLFVILGATDDADDDGVSIRFRITSIPDPAAGHLRDSSNTPITEEGHVLRSSFTTFGWKMSFFPADGFSGVATFTYEVYDVYFDDELNQEVIIDTWPEELSVDIHIPER